MTVSCFLYKSLAVAFVSLHHSYDAILRGKRTVVMNFCTSATNSSC